MAATILAVSEDDAFATMLQEGLEGVGDYSVIVAHSGHDAQRIAGSQHVDLLIVDTNLEQCAPAQVVADVRAQRPQTRLMWMPFLGQELPAELAEMDSQGLLNKPFFVEDLYRQIELALGHAVDDEQPAASPVPAPEPGAAASRPSAGAETDAPSHPGEPPSPLSARAERGTVSTVPAKDEAVAASEPQDDAGTTKPATRRIVLGSDRPSLVGRPRGAGTTPALWSPAPGGTPFSRPRGTPSRPVEGAGGPLEARLKTLARGLNAEAALLLDREGHAVAWTGFVHQWYAPELAAIVAAEFAASERIAGLLHERNGRFATHIHEGEELLLFSTFLWDSDLILSVAVRADMPLDAVRYQVRQATTELIRHARK